MLDFDFGEFFSDDESASSDSPSQWPNWPAGSMPHSLRLPEVKLYRYQSKGYIELGDTWYRMVWDTKRKWTAANRYSAEDVSPGHFFSVSPEGALAEMNAYGAKIDDYELLEFTLSIDNLLDLTDTDALSWFYKKHFDPDSQWHWGVILDSLFHQQKGGDTHNAYAGHKALLDGYNGIAFFGARAVAGWWTDPGSMDHRDWDLVGFYHKGMRKEPSCINVVIYFGHNVVQSTHRISFNGQEIHNPFFGAPIDRIDRLFQADPLRPLDEDLSFEEERFRVSRKAWVRKPGIIEENSGS